MKIERILELQDKLNKKIVNDKWYQNSYLKWNICIITEVSELLESYPIWKHWNNKKPDYKNIKLEIVDIYHFIISKILSHTKNDYVEAKKLIINNFIKMIKNNNQIEDDIFVIIEKFICSVVNNEYDRMIQLYYLILKYFNITIDELHKTYIVKNAINILRKKFGYKDNKYIKIWNGKEDNEVIMDLITDTHLKNLTFDEIVEMIENYYINNVSKQDLI